MKLKSYISLFLFLGVLSAYAQEPVAEEEKEKKASVLAEQYSSLAG